MESIPKKELYLEHYGVKGMKWGVRKQEDKKSSDSPVSKSEIRKKKKQKTRNSKLILAGGAAAVVGGVYAVNKITKNSLSKHLPRDAIRRGRSAAVRTASNVSNWNFVGGLNPISIATTVGREYVYNYMNS